MPQWHDHDPEWVKTYDATMQKVRDSLGSYNRIAGGLYRLTGEHITGSGVRRWVLEGGIPLKWACSLIDLLAENEVSLTLLDFYPWVDDYLEPLDFMR